MVYLTILAVGWFITEFEPLQWGLSKLNDKLPKSDLINYLRGAFTCWQCMTFWFGLAYTQDFFVAAAASFMTMIITVWQNKK